MGNRQSYRFEEKMAGSQNILSMKEVAYKLNVCTRTIYMWIEQGLFPKLIKLKVDSRNIFFNKAEIDLWIEKCSMVCYKVKKGITPTSYKAKMQGLK